MLSLAIRNFSARPLRALSTALAVFFGVAMVAGTLHADRLGQRGLRRHLHRGQRGHRRSCDPEGHRRGRLRRVLRTRSPRGPGRTTCGGRRGRGRRGRDRRRHDHDRRRRGRADRPARGRAAAHRAQRADRGRRVLRRSPWSRARTRRRPTRRVIDSITAEDEGYALGDTIRVTGAAGETDYTVSGIAEFGSGASLGGASLIQFVKSEAQRLTGKEGRVDEIDVTAADGIVAGRARVARLAPPCRPTWSRSRPARRPPTPTRRRSRTASASSPRRCSYSPASRSSSARS